MKSSDLTAEQLEPLEEKTREMLAYLHALKSRMEQQGFPTDDELYRLVVDAQDRIHRLRVKLHYEYCDRKRPR